MLAYRLCSILACALWALVAVVMVCVIVHAMTPPVPVRILPPCPDGQRVTYYNCDPGYVPEEGT